MKVSSILVVFAMQTEANPLLSALDIKKDGGKPLEPPLPPIYYSTTHLGIQINLVVNGQDPVYELDSFGTDAATLSTYLGIKKFSPDLVMSAGVAGGFKTQAEIGDVYLSKDSVRYSDRRVSITDPNYQDYAIGFFIAAKAIVNFHDAAGIASQFQDNFSKATNCLGYEVFNIIVYLSKNPLGEETQQAAH